MDKAWMRGVWEMVKAALSQKLLTNHLPSSSSSSLSTIIPHRLSGISVIVTGATSGIGLETARELAMAGAHVVMACRNTGAAEELANAWNQSINAAPPPTPMVEVMHLDLLSLTSVREFGAEWERRGAPLHVLINNAGVLRSAEPQIFSSDGLEQHVQVNHVGPALLTLLLLPSLLRAGSSRVINVNSVAHHCAVVDPDKWTSKIENQKYSSLRTYGASKLAHLMFLRTLASKLMEQRQTSIHCIAVHPGIVTTNLVPSFSKKSFWQFNPFEGARSVLFCATNADMAENLVKGFAYYSCDCKPAKVSPLAADVASCARVWEKTLHLCGLHVDYVSHVITASTKIADPQ
ncbi:retinol dehydrogenase 12-like [Amborella trichopoda]|uniref:retinol dehydrogenase 12-like n=1 Tax=Amborella trichopoda TaxID=13333 RepID=UPI0009BEC75D|nr:retinol dehydrogenase 12-like [Amborella trichopoda]|eukprot:XP_020518596.1 retinol dehydrogenase 12-like [Amborella trichopoda]